MNYNEFKVLKSSLGLSDSIVETSTNGQLKMWTDDMKARIDKLSKRVSPLQLAAVMVRNDVAGWTQFRVYERDAMLAKSRSFELIIKTPLHMVEMPYWIAEHQRVWKDVVNHCEKLLRNAYQEICFEEEI